MDTVIPSHTHSVTASGSISGGSHRHGGAENSFYNGEESISTAQGTINGSSSADYRYLRMKQSEYNTYGAISKNKYTAYTGPGTLTFKGDSVKTTDATNSVATSVSSVSNMPPYITAYCWRKTKSIAETTTS